MVRLATLDDVDVLAASQARAFYDDPLQVWALPDDATRLAILEAIFHAQLGVVAIPLGASYTDDTCSVGAFWAPPGRWRLPPEEAARLAPVGEITGARYRFLGIAYEAMAAHHPEEPHWYLAGLGTDPSAQGRGLATAALQPVLSRCDEQHECAYLESTREQNVAFYEHRGFVVTGTIEIPERGPTLWQMWRDPA